MIDQFYGLNPKIKVNCKGMPFQLVTVKYNKRELYDLENMINISSMYDYLKQELIKQCHFDISRHIHTLTFDHKKVKPVHIDSAMLMHKMAKMSAEKSARSIITNAKNGVSIQDNPFYMRDLFETTVGRTNVFQAGSYLGLVHYVDPNMEWGDNRVSVLFNNFYNFKIIIVDDQNLEDDAHLDTQTDMDKEYRLEALIYMKVNNPNYKLYTYDSKI